MGSGGGVNSHAHRYVFILPTKPVFPFFGIEASLGDKSSLRRFTFCRRLVEIPENKFKKND